MERARLEVVLDVLNAVRHDGRRFGMGAYVSVIHGHSRLRGYLPEPPLIIECCAIGWAAQDPALKEQGLHLSIVGMNENGKVIPDYPEGSNDRRRIGLLRAGCDAETLDVMPFFGEIYGIQAVAMFFGMSPRSAANCFLPTAYRPPSEWDQIRPEHVIARIQAEMRGHYGP